MPQFEPVSIAGQRYALYHVGPRQAVFPSSPGANVSLLARTDMVSKRLPMSDIPGSPDFVSGSWTTRLDDAGEATFLFPNTVSSDGVPWRSRFDPAGHLQFLIITDNGELDFVGVIDQLPQTTDQQVQVHCSDGWWLLKKAYERDWIVVQSPRDVIERATQLWVPTTVDSFPASSSLTGGVLTTPNGTWTITTVLGAAAAVGASGGLVLTSPAVNNASVTAASPTITVAASGTWRAQLYAPSVNLSSRNVALGLTVVESNGDSYGLALTGVGAAGVIATLSVGGTVYGQSTLATATSYGLVVESDGEWIWAYVNGQQIGGLRRIHSSTTSLSCSIFVATQNLGAGSATITGVLLGVLQPFLQRGSDKGDYVLPGTASTYPSGGLHARYFNDTDLQSDANRLLKIHAPPRTQAYAGSGVSEYANQQDATINGQAAPTPGAAPSNWSVIWFGAIYLKLSAGDYTITLNYPSGGSYASRVWVGKTQFGSQVIDQWTWQTSMAVNGTISASALAGTLPYGAGTVHRDGWYPIKIEYAVDSLTGGASGVAPVLAFTPPGAYTDPGGTAIASGGSILVPATSLSPLGCVDQRYQGVSHFDLAQQTIQAFGYQAAVEPYALESGLFPGVLAPRIREGHDSDVVLKPDRSIRRDGEGLVNYSATLDATDFAASLQGNGAGFQNGTTGQLQALVYDPATLLGSLFDAQAWQDFSDAGFQSLLQALLNSQLGLRLTPWQALQADPEGRARWANTWPLPGSLAKMRWRPGDGLQIQAPEINVVDSSPRQMLVVTRNITPLGATGTQATFANRPRTPAKTLKQQIYSATRWQRNYQRQLVTINGMVVSGSIAAGATSAVSIASPMATDQIVRARVRITQSTGAVPMDVVINGVDQTTTLQGPWTTAPVNLEIDAVATPDANGNLSAAIKNTSGVTASTITFQLLVDVLR